MCKRLTNKEKARRIALKDMKKEDNCLIVPKKREFDNGIITFMQF